MNREEKLFKDIFVSYEVAKKLKEIEFKIDTVFGYYGHDIPYLFIFDQLIKRRCFNIIGISTVTTMREDLLEDYPNIEIVLAPTYEQVLKWFREKGYYNNVIHTDKGVTYAFWKVNDTWYEQQTFDTYEEARKQLILKLIETYKGFSDKEN